MWCCGLRIVEIFRSFQGEGPLAGSPAVFLRLAYCNLFCSWCDTKYSWAFGSRARILGIQPLNDVSVEAGPGEVVEILEKLGGDLRHVVITGGEPLIWARELAELSRELKRLGWFIEVETNGTLDPGDLERHVDQFNVSPKLSNSGIPERIRINPRALRRFAAIRRAIFKFVVEREEDGREIEDLVERFSIPRERVYMMSQCTSPKECAEKDEKITIPLANKMGTKYTRRLHIIEGFR